MDVQERYNFETDVATLFVEVTVPADIGLTEATSLRQQAEDAIINRSKELGYEAARQEFTWRTYATGDTTRNTVTALFDRSELVNDYEEVLRKEALDRREDA